MFTLEIDGRPIAITDADEQEARRVFEGESFRQDMRRWLAEGRPVWDGQAAFQIRSATEREISQFQAPDPNPPHGAEDDHGPTIMMLIDAHDPDEIEED